MRMKEKMQKDLYSLPHSFSFRNFIWILYCYTSSINFLGNYSVSSEIFNDFDLNSYIGLLRASVLLPE